MDTNRIVAKLEELRRKKRKQSHIRESYRRKLLKRRITDAVDEYIDGIQQEEELVRGAPDELSTEKTNT